MSKSTKPRGLARQLAELEAIRSDPSPAVARKLLVRSLESERSHVVARAAAIVAEAELRDLSSALLDATQTWMKPAPDADPNCFAKVALVRALYELSVKADQSFLTGIRLVQLEPVWGDVVDMAPELRGLCGLALVRTNYFDALAEVAELLADAEPIARLAAARAIAYSERQDVGVPLLRFKARLGDEDARVVAACLTGLLSLAPAASLEFVAALLGSEIGQTREAALIALGESRLAGALQVLVRCVETSLPEPQLRIGYLAIALLRSDAAFDFLLGVVSSADRMRAERALTALATYRSDSSLRERVLATVRKRGDKHLRTVFDGHWDK
ncbi:MAG TPA: hypothetical protein VJV78_41195 [Polyangiales bacterium]|nr:hypothetical protein [Polyangiales bacterium]